VRIEGTVSTELLLNIFAPKTPLHDGAVILRNNHIVAAGCFLPLTDKAALPSELGTRHRAALGVAEVSDALVLVVSEETGTVSLAMGTEFQRGLDESTLRRLIVTALEQNSGFLRGWTR
jgi:diadenylate cyclase